MSIYNQTISTYLYQTLMVLMKSPNLNHFRLAHGTALSLQLGHRLSKEIDLETDHEFTDADFNRVKAQLQNSFGHVEHHQVEKKGNGTSFFLFNLNKDYIKVDIYYTPNKFIREPREEEYIRMAAIEDIVAMKLEAIRKGGQKLDFWDLHALLSDFKLAELLRLHQERFPDSHNKKELLGQLTNFRIADEDFEPNCLQRKNWNLIKLDIADQVKGMSK